MGLALARAALDSGHQVTIVSGPVAIDYPSECELHSVVTTDELLEACCRQFSNCDGLIGAAAPCDYRPVRVAPEKIAKTGDPLLLELVETPDVVASLGAIKRPSQWIVGFALETNDERFRAITKMLKKSCDLMVVNGPSAIDSLDNRVEILAPTGSVVSTASGSKYAVAEEIMRQINRLLIRVPTG